MRGTRQPSFIHSFIDQTIAMVGLTAAPPAAGLRQQKLNNGASQQASNGAQEAQGISALGRERLHFIPCLPEVLRGELPCMFMQNPTLDTVSA